MFTTNQGQLPTTFMESTATHAGTLSPHERKVSNLTRQRRKAESDISIIANRDNATFNEVITRVLSNSIPELTAYVHAHGESASQDPVKLAVQAILLRASEVADLAKMLTTTDEDALMQLEEAEQDAIDISHADSYHMLPADVQAAIKVAIDFMKSKRSKQGKSDKLPDILKDLKRATGASNSYGINTVPFISVPDHEPIGSKSPGGSSLGNVSFPDYSNGWNGFATDDLDVLAGTQTGTAGATGGGGGGFDWSSVLGAINGIISSVGGIIDKGKDAATGVIQQGQNAIQNAGGTFLGGALSTALKNNLPLILGGLGLFVLILIVVIYAVKSK
jgi:hypothetical protein